MGYCFFLDSSDDIRRCLCSRHSWGCLGLALDFCSGFWRASCKRPAVAVVAAVAVVHLQQTLDRALLRLQLAIVLVVH